MSWPTAIKLIALEEEDNIEKLLEIIAIMPEIINLTTNSGSSTLHFCVLEDKPKSLNLLLSKGCDVNIRNCYEETPLHWVAKSGKVNMCKILLENGADVNVEDVDGNSPLHWACEAGNPEIIKLLLECKDINVENENYQNLTPLEVAISNGEHSSVRLLLKRYNNFSRKQLKECAEYSEDLIIKEIVKNFSKSSLIR